MPPDRSIPADSFAGKVVLVTGAGGGIGAPIARAFAAAGARVHATDIDAAAVARALSGGMQGVHAVDVADAASIRACHDRIVADDGAIDVLVNAAGVYSGTHLFDATTADFQRIMGVNVLGTLLMTQAVAPAMIAAGRGGAIINIASVAGRRGDPQTAIYSASKAAVISLTQSSALALAGHGIRVNAVAPGGIDTAMWDAAARAYAARLGGTAAAFTRSFAESVPAGRIGQPDDVVDTVLYLASDLARYVVGQTLNVDGGLYFS